MIPWLAYPVAIGAAVPTTLVVLALWMLRAAVVDHDSVDSVFLPMVFLLVPLIFFVSIAGNVVGVLVGQIASIVAPMAARLVAVLAAGVVCAAACVWSQRGTFGRRSNPVSASAVVLLAVADMLILAGGLSLLPGKSNL
ncbi:hypothetical protein ASE86_05800 [Sphingomonas sp. Leaf33]|uniref:hypothetical protein n=1 Tax=Sphingomonas sp. Leaf33 TaxID=1736215 RepID=UPI0006FFFB26|nr:hypothetical protein [Sphingomonas sp. Leaf33]KQN25719.1 hypothetical protein ASE86_05800 [Sphingomonas sp. Leaf33]